MVKSPNIRHSKSRRQPMTIELAPGEVSRIDAASSADGDTAAEAPAAAVEAEAAADPVAGQPLADAGSSAEMTEPGQPAPSTAYLLADQTSDDTASPRDGASDAAPGVEPAGAEEDTFF